MRETMIEQLRRLEREKRDAAKPEPTIMEILKREEVKLGAKLVPVRKENDE